jgi:hypothetical protein
MHDLNRRSGIITLTSPMVVSEAVASRSVTVGEIRLHDYRSIVVVRHIFIVRDILIDRRVIGIHRGAGVIGSEGMLLYIVVSFGPAGGTDDGIAASEIAFIMERV